jgi:OFA family oxalate/formate antiporter-like MFS transporter
MQAEERVGMSRWWRVLGGLSMTLALGTLYAWSVFVAPLEDRFGWKRADTSMVFTIAVIVFALSFVVAGRIQDRYGPLWCSLVGGILVSLGFYLCSFTTSLNYLYLCFGVIGGLGNGFGYATPIPVMAKWFPDNRGLAIGLAVGGYGAGSAIFGPLAQLKLIPAYGLPATFRILGAIFLVMTMAGALLLRNPPPEYRPGKWSPKTDGNTPAGRQFTPGEMLRTRTFYLMWVAYALGCSAGLMVISQLVPFARSVGIKGAALSTMTLVVGAFGNTAGRIVSGWMSDRIGRINVLRTMIGISVVAMPAL